MSRLIFPSVAKPTFRFCLYGSYYDSPLRDHDGRYAVDKQLTFYDTYGDGDTQHCHEGFVGPEMLADFWCSLALYACENDIGETLADYWPAHNCHAGRDELAFLLSVKFKPGKRQYLSVRDSKISTNTAKQYDTRWAEVPEWADGSIKSAFGLKFREGSTSGIHRWVYLSALADQWYAEHGQIHSASDLLELAFGIKQENTAANRNANLRLSDALGLLQKFVDARRLADGVSRSAAAFKSNLENDARSAAEAAVKELETPVTEGAPS